MCVGEGLVSAVIRVNTRAHAGAFWRSGFRCACLCMRMYSCVYTCGRVWKGEYLNGGICALGL